jgi:TolA-binding protein
VIRRSRQQTGLSFCFCSPHASSFPSQITDLRQRLADSQKAVVELEAEREQRQRDYDKKLLLAKSKIENVQVGRTPHTS